MNEVALDKHLEQLAFLRFLQNHGDQRILFGKLNKKFFGRHGFVEIEGTPVAPDVYKELLRSYDAGVAEFLDLEAVKPNTLGNTRMLLSL